MPKAKRVRCERTDTYHLIQQWCRTPEQRLYEGIRPIVLFGLTTQERADETSLAEHTLRRASDAFDRQGLLSLFRPTQAERESHPRSLPVMMRQLIVDLKTEYSDFTLGEIATICAINFDGRRPSHRSVQAVLTDGPRPSRTTRQFPTYAEMADPEERRLAIFRLHAQGWAIATIAHHLEVSHPAVYTTLAMDAPRAMLIALLLFDVLGTLPTFWQLGSIYAAVFLASACAQFFNPARFTSISDLVEEPSRARASGLSQTTLNLANIVGPPIAVLLLFVVGVQCTNEKTHPGNLMLDQARSSMDALR